MTPRTPAERVAAWLAATDARTTLVHTVDRYGDGMEGAALYRADIESLLTASPAAPEGETPRVWAEWWKVEGRHLDSLTRADLAETAFKAGALAEYLTSTAALATPPAPPAPDGTRAALEGGTASWLADRLSDLSREIGSTANGAHCYGVWARRLSWLSAYAAALAASPAPAPTTERLMTGEQLAVLADDIADMAQDFVTARDAKSLRNMAANLAGMIRLHVPAPAPSDDGGPNGTA